MALRACVERLPRASALDRPARWPATRGLGTFFGRFHPMAIHLPIGLLVLVPVLEIAGKRRPALREAAGFVLAIAFLACLARAGSGSCWPMAAASQVRAFRGTWPAASHSPSQFSLCLLARPRWSWRKPAPSLPGASYSYVHDSRLGGAPGRLAYAWRQLPHRIHAIAIEAISSARSAVLSILLRQAHPSHLRRQLRSLPRPVKVKAVCGLILMSS